MKKKTKVPINWEDRPGSFERFEKLTRGLMAVPKKELDKKPTKNVGNKRKTRHTPDN